MSDFFETLSYFLSERRNDILQEACNNDDYASLKTKCTVISEKLQASVPTEYKALLNDFVDAIAAIGSMEDSYYYLCGLRDGNKPDSHYNSISKDTRTEIAIHTRYAGAESKRAEKYNELQALIDSTCRKLLEEYIEIKSIILDIEKNYCYTGGLSDKKRLDKQFDPLAANEWNELLNTFL